MRLVVTYSRRDRAKAHSLVEGLEMMGHDAWMDRDIAGGEAWWNAILGRIRDSDALVFALSPAALDSEACNRELQWATALGKPVLPVMVEFVSAELLPPGLAVVQFIDFTTGEPAGAFRLAGALSRLPATPELPDPLPKAPPVPVSYMSELNDRVRAPTLTLDEQLALAAKLKAALQRETEREAAVELVHKLKERRDLFVAAAKELDALAAEVPPPAPVPARQHGLAAVAQAQSGEAAGAGSAAEPAVTGEQKAAEKQVRVAQAAPAPPSPAAAESQRVEAGQQVRTTTGVQPGPDWNKRASVALGCGIASVITAPFSLGLGGLVLGITAIVLARQVRRGSDASSRARVSGRLTAANWTAGLGCFLAVALWLIVLAANSE